VFEEYRELGFNYRTSDVHAAIGIAQLESWTGCWRKGAQS
jgi:dTDP-4-amino-4,6-dideoxygalactose transaminase